MKMIFLLAIILVGSCHAEIVLPDEYYNDSLTQDDLSVVVQLVDGIPFVLNAEDCSVRSAFIEWALENDGIDTKFCYKPTKINDLGQSVYHIWLKAEEENGYCYIDTEPRYPNSIIREDSSVWSWYDVGHMECDDLLTMCLAFENIDPTFDTENEFGWWRYPKMESLKAELEG
jgi:hypothetical protein